MICSTKKKESIEKHDFLGRSLYNSGSYYENKKDYGQMIKFYSMAIEIGNVDAMCNLGKYY